LGSVTQFLVDAEIHLSKLFHVVCLMAASILVKAHGVCMMTEQLQTVVRRLQAVFARQQLQDMPDCQLLTAFVDSRHEDAFACILRRHGPMVMWLARRVLRDHQLAEDVYQATFLVLARKAGSIRRRDSLPAWLHHTAFRLAIRAKKSHKHLPKWPERPDGEMMPSPLDDLSACELLAILDEELARLPEKYRLPIILCHLEGLTKEAAAKRLGTSTDAVRGKLERGRLLLRKRLVGRGFPAGAMLAGAAQLQGTAQAIPPTLVQCTLRAALTGTGASARAVALAEGTAILMTLSKIKTICLTVLFVGALGGGAAWVGGISSSQQTNSNSGTDSNRPAQIAVQKSDRAKTVDLYGDPLPPGVARRLGTVQMRAANTRLALSADGKTLIGVHAGRHITSWDAQTGQLKGKKDLGEIAVADGPLGVDLFQVSPDGRHMAAWTQKDRTWLEIWDIAAGRLLHKKPLDEENKHAKTRILMNAPAFSPDGRHVGFVWPVSDSTQRVQVLDVESGKETFARDLAGASSFAWSFTPDNKGLVAVPHNPLNSSWCFDLTGKERWRSEGHGWPWLAFTPDGRVFSSNEALDLASGKPAARDGLPAGGDWITGVLTPDGEKLALAGAVDNAGRSRVLLLWDIKNGKKLHALAVEADEIVASRDSQSFITNCGGLLQRWDLTSGKACYHETGDRGHFNAVTELVFSADGKLLASSGNDGTVRLWDFATGKPVYTWASHQRSLRVPYSVLANAYVSMDMTPDGRWLVSAGIDNIVRTWNGTTGVEGVSMVLPATDYIYVATRLDGQTVYAVGFEHGGDQWLQSWDLQTGISVAKHQVQGTWPPFGLSPVGKALIMGGTVFNLDGARQKARLQKPIYGPIAFGSTGSLIASQGRFVDDVNDPTSPVHAAVWEAATGQLVTHFTTTDGGSCLAFHPGSRWVALANYHGIEIVDMATGQVVTAFKVPEANEGRWNSSARSLAFTPDGRQLAAGLSDGTILIFNVELPASATTRLEAKELNMLWASLRGDAAKAWQAIWRLAEAPDVAVPFLQSHLQQLDSKLSGKSGPALDAAALQGVRAVAVLARINSAEARQVLQTLAKGAEAAPLTVAAKAALGN
jgi:RNA polymerase sigma factor (sigma-70 family)